MSVIQMSDLELSGKRVLIREDLNVPVDSGKVTSDVRIRASLPTIRAAQEAGAAVMLMSHLGRPTEGQPDDTFSLRPVAERLSELLGRDVQLISDWIDGVDVAPGDVVLLENVRFLDGEKACDEGLARKMASLCDVFVMDAFGTAHRAQASTYGVAEHAPVACAGSSRPATATSNGSPRSSRSAAEPGPTTDDPRAARDRDPAGRPLPRPRRASRFAPARLAGSAGWRRARPRGADARRCQPLDLLRSLRRPRPGGARGGGARRGRSEALLLGRLPLVGSADRSPAPAPREQGRFGSRRSG